MQKLLTSLLGIFLLASMAGCTTQQTQNEQNVQVVKIGVILPLSGPASNYGADAANVYQMLVDEFNASHNDIQAQLIIEDDKAEPKDAVSATQKLLSVDKVDVILGPLFSAAATPSATLAQENKTPFLTPTASANSISTLGDYVYRYRNDEFATQKVAQYLNTQEVKKLLFIGENTDSGIDYRNGLKKYFDGEVADIMVATNEKDYKLLAKQIKTASQNADYLVFFPVNDSSAYAIIAAMNAEGLLDTFKNKIFTNEIIIHDSAIAQLGNNIEGFKTATFALTLNTPASSDNFLQQFNQKYTMQAAPYLLLLEGEGLSLILDTVAQVGKDKEAIKKTWDSITTSNPRHGLFGSYYFDENGDAIGLEFVLQQIQNGEIVAVE